MTITTIYYLTVAAMGIALVVGFVEEIFFDGISDYTASLIAAVAVLMMLAIWV